LLSLSLLLIGYAVQRASYARGLVGLRHSFLGDLVADCVGVAPALRKLLHLLVDAPLTSLDVVHGLPRRVYAAGVELLLLLLHQATRRLLRALRLLKIRLCLRVVARCRRATLSVRRVLHLTRRVGKLLRLLLTGEALQLPRSLIELLRALLAAATAAARLTGATTLSERIGHALLALVLLLITLRQLLERLCDRVYLRLLLLLLLVLLLLLLLLPALDLLVLIAHPFAAELEQVG
jgi:hypothetical protein